MKPKPKTVQAILEGNTFPLLLDGLGFRHSKTLHGLVLLLRRLLLVGRGTGLAISERVDQHAAVEGVAVPGQSVAGTVVDCEGGERQMRQVTKDEWRP